jgi:hypothetical protein
MACRFQKTREIDRLKLSRFAFDGGGGLSGLLFSLGGVAVMASAEMTSVGQPPYTNNAVSTWNALQDQADRDNLITPVRRLGYNSRMNGWMK